MNDHDSLKNRVKTVITECKSLMDCFDTLLQASQKGKSTQLKEIERTIDNMQKKDLTIPPELRKLKLDLLSDLDAAETQIVLKRELIENMHRIFSMKIPEVKNGERGKYRQRTMVRRSNNFHFTNCHEADLVFGRGLPHKIKNFDETWNNINQLQVLSYKGVRMPKRILDLPEADRPRERLQKKGADALSDLELLAILIGSGTSKRDVMAISKKMISVIDEKGIQLTVNDLIEVDGIGMAKASTIIAAFEFIRRRIKPEGLKIIKPIDVLQLIQHYADRPQEHFIAISVNGANEVMNIRVVTIGLVNQSQVHPREIFADIITDRASSVIVAHNHPSGNLIPSKNDILITQKIKAAAQVLGINFLDHIIFGKKGYYSFLEKKQL